MTDAPDPGRAVLVTGASRGIGAATAQVLAHDGWTVFVNYHRSAEAAHALVEAIVRAGGRAHAVRGDVASDADVSAIFAEVDRVAGRLDALVNNAGVLGTAVSAADMTEGDLLSVFRTNLFGLVACTREAVRRMSTRRGGRGGVIVNVGSTASRNGGLPTYAHYAASKGAVDSLTLAMAKELGPHGIRINVLRPGLIATDIHDPRGGVEALRPLQSQIPLGHLGEPSEIADTIAWLLSPRASFVHGTCIDVAGGR